MRRIDYNQLPHQRKSSSSQKLNRHLEKKRKRRRKEEGEGKGRKGRRKLRIIIFLKLHVNYMKPIENRFSIENKINEMFDKVWQSDLTF